MARVTRYVNPS